jgi:hypothetical protein
MVMPSPWAGEPGPALRLVIGVPGIEARIRRSEREGAAPPASQPAIAVRIDSVGTSTSTSFCSISMRRMSVIHPFSFRLLNMIRSLTKGRVAACSDLISSQTKFVDEMIFNPVAVGVKGWGLVVKFSQALNSVVMPGVDQVLEISLELSRALMALGRVFWLKMATLVR